MPDMTVAVTVIANTRASAAAAADATVAVIFEAAMRFFLIIFSANATHMQRARDQI